MDNNYETDKFRVRFRRGLETLVSHGGVRHAAVTRVYDSEDRVCCYALTNAAGRGLGVALSYRGSYLTNTVYALPDGGVLAARLTRDPGRRNLVTRRDHTFNGNSIYWYSTGFDLLGRPTNATDSVSLARKWLYNRRSELAAALIGTNSYGYAYDTIGNRTLSYANVTTNTYTANNLNQYTQVGRDAPIAPPVAFSYDADGNMTNDGRFTYTFDAENRLLSACPIVPAENALAVEHAYDHRHHRIRKTVKRYNGAEWQLAETHDFVWDGNNIILETIAFADGTMRTCEYFWGNDLSGTEQGAGGVGGLLSVSVDGAFFIPCYDHNGNIVCYVSESGSIAAQYVYAPYGNVVEQYGSNPNLFNFGFSTKYLDREVDLVGYQYRFLRPSLGRWLNRDPIEERGGENLYAMCNNNPVLCLDIHGLIIFVTHTPGTPPPTGWSSSLAHGMEVATFRSYKVNKITYSNGRVGFSIEFENPSETRIDIYVRLTATRWSFEAESEHVACDVPYDEALGVFKTEVESIYACPADAQKLWKEADDRRESAWKACQKCNYELDKPGGPHGHY